MGSIGPGVPSDPSEHIGPSSAPSHSSAMSEAESLMQQKSPGFSAYADKHGSKLNSWNSFGRMMNEKANFLAKSHPGLAPELKATAGKMGKAFQHSIIMYAFDQYKQMLASEKRAKQQRQQTYGKD